MTKSTLQKQHNGAMKHKEHSSIQSGEFVGGAVCPYCKSTNTNQENGIWYCYDCGKEW